MKKNKLLILFISISIIIIALANLIYPGHLAREKTGSLDDLEMPEGYRASLILKGLRNPSSFFINKDGDIYVSENAEGTGRIIKYTQKGQYSLIADGLNTPVGQIIINKDVIYISHKGKISKLESGEVKDLVTGLPSFGDYSNNGIYFGPDGMIYICQGAATNSGIVGTDNHERGWLDKYPFFHDYAPMDVVLNGLNFKGENLLTSDKNDRASTGAFQSFNSQTAANQEIKGRLPGNASVLRINPNGDLMDLFAWGVRNPTGIVVLPDGKGIVAVQGMENRGSRPIAGGRDYIYEIKKGTWLGWPDYEGGEPVSQQKFKAKNHQMPQFLTALHPTTTPQKPIVSFEESGRIGIIDICRGNELGLRGQIIAPLKKGEKQEAKIAAVDLKNSVSVDFIKNKKGKELLQNPTQCVIGNDGKLYILESARGAIIKVEKEDEVLKRILPMYIPTEYFIGFIIISFSVYLVFAVRRNKSE